MGWHLDTPSKTVPGGTGFEGGQGSFFFNAGQQAAISSLLPRVAIIFPLRPFTREESLLIDAAISRLGSAYYAPRCQPAPAGEKGRGRFLADSAAERKTHTQALYAGNKPAHRCRCPADCLRRLSAAGNKPALRCRCLAAWNRTLSGAIGRCRGGSAPSPGGDSPARQWPCRGKTGRCF